MRLAGIAASLKTSLEALFAEATMQLQPGAHLVDKLGELAPLLARLLGLIITLELSLPRPSAIYDNLPVRSFIPSGAPFLMAGGQSSRHANPTLPARAVLIFVPHGAPFLMAAARDAARQPAAQFAVSSCRVPHFCWRHHAMPPAKVRRAGCGIHDTVVSIVPIPGSTNRSDWSDRDRDENGRAVARAEPTMSSKPSAQISASIALFVQGLFQALPRRCPSAITLHEVPGGANARFARFKAAFASYKRVLQLDAGHVEAHCKIGSAYREIGRLDEAIAHFQKWAHSGDTLTSSGSPGTRTSPGRSFAVGPLKKTPYLPLPLLRSDSGGSNVRAQNTDGPMEGDWGLRLLNEMLWNGMLVAGPLLLAALGVGLMISVFQVATQLQEMTLSYVPKLIVSATVLLLLGGWMMHRITLFAFEMISLIPSLSG